VLLALDADSAGQEAMLKASTQAAKRNLELRVVALPAGADPADLIRQGGPEAIKTAVEQSVPFVRFRVERVLAGGDDSSPEGRDRMIEALRPIFATLPPSAMRMELTRIVSSRLALPERMAETLLAAGGSSQQSLSARPATSEGRGAGGEAQREPPAHRGGDMTRREDTERAFLALCISSPEEGARALAGLEVDEHFSTGLLRRAAARLREGDLREPMSDPVAGSPPLDDDPPLKGLLAELVVEAGREQSEESMPDVRPLKLEAQRLQLELARVERQIQRARTQESGDISDLAHHRSEVKREFDRAFGRVMEATASG
jgi:DNA primase